MKKQFKLIISEFQERAIPNLTEREQDIPLNSKKIISLIGVRRSGKTSILFNMIKKLRQKVSNENIVYLNFEDDRLFEMELNNLNDLIDAYYELYPAKRAEKIYLFFDEIQNIDNWELFVRRVYDTLDVQIFITGSSSKLLSAEIATSLRGRTITYEIFPFSFKEILEHKDIAVNLHSPSSLSYIKNELESYLKSGGFPEIIDEDSFFQKKILSGYMDLIIYKDIVERHGITNRDLLKHLIKYCFVNMGTLLSFNKLYNEYKSRGFKLTKNSLYDYFSYLEEAFAFFKVPIYRDSIREEMRNPKKIYAVDNGFKALFDFSFSDDYSKLYENIVFLHLRRQSSEIYYYKEKQEVDFYCVIDGTKQLINVSYDLSGEKTRDREISGLVEAMKYFNIKKSFLITREEAAVEYIDECEIIILPLYEFLLTTGS